MAIAIVAGIGFPGTMARGQILRPDSLLAPSSRPFWVTTKKLTTPELERREANRLKMQREGYADVLFQLRRNDGLWGLIASLRSTLQLDYSLPRDYLVIFIPIRQPERKADHLPGFTGAPSPPMAIPLVENRVFPEDPWAKR